MIITMMMMVMMILRSTECTVGRPAHLSFPSVSPVNCQSSRPQNRYSYDSSSYPIFLLSFFLPSSLSYFIYIHICIYICIYCSFPPCLCRLIFLTCCKKITCSQKGLTLCFVSSAVSFRGLREPAWICTYLLRETSKGLKQVSQQGLVRKQDKQTNNAKETEKNRQRTEANTETWTWRRREREREMNRETGRGTE